MCRATPGCAAFVYLTDGGSRCSLKAHVLKRHSSTPADRQACAEGGRHAASVGGVMAAPRAATTDGCITPAETHPNRVFGAPAGLGGAKTVFAATPYVCCRKCKQQLKCKTFSWNKIWQSCRLHFGASELAPQLEAISGRVRK